MPLGKSLEMDARRALPSSSYCSTSTFVVFVALCLVGIWMMKSLTITPEEFSPFGTNTQPSNDYKGDLARDLVRGSEETDVSGNNAPDESKDQHSDDLEEKSLEEKNKGNDTGNESGKKDRTQDFRNDNKEAQDKPKENIEDNAAQNKEDKNHTEKEKLKDSFPDGTEKGLLDETTTQNGSWSTQAVESKDENEMQSSPKSDSQSSYTWKLCNVSAGADYIPCLDNTEAIMKLRSTKHYEHRERHCPEEPPTCLVPLPDGYRSPVSWPESRDKIWFSNIPHTQLVEYKGGQNWIKASGDYLTFPGGGTQFKRGVLHYIDFIQEAKTDIAWGQRTRVVLDVGCGVASFGGYLFDRDVLTMSLAPKDEHEAQVQFALERGIPAISAVMGTKRLPFPSEVFDLVHCARCRVPWHIEGGKLLLELNRLLRPGGYFVWSATPVYRKKAEDVKIWEAMSALTKTMCWTIVNRVKDSVNSVGIIIFRKPTDNNCFDTRTEENPPLCQEHDNPDAAWNVTLQTCMHKVPVDPASRGSQWPEQWPVRLEKTPYWLKSSDTGVYGKAAPEDFQADYEHWKRVVTDSYVTSLGIDWSTIRNVMDMKAVYGGFAAALRDMKVWVMNVVPIDSPDTLPVVFERGLIGIYHDWCESLSTYPRTYDLLHANHLFSNIKRRCKLLPVMVEVDRVMRPESKLIVRDNLETIGELENLAKSLHWEVRVNYSEDNEGLLFVQKTLWRPNESEESL